MNISGLNDKQKGIYDKLLEGFDNEQQLQNWMSIPNRYFRNKAPIDVLISQNYDYFDRFLETSNIE